MTPSRVPSFWVGFLVVFLSSWPQAVRGAPGDEHWSPQFGIPGTTNTVYAMALKHGRLYTSGQSVSTNCTLTLWDGRQWSTLGNFSGNLVQVLDMAFVGETLYVAGVFTNASGVPANGLARWDGNAWSGIGLSGSAYGLAADGNDLYVAGIFTNAGSVIMTNVGRWDGNAWHALGDGLGKPASSVGRDILVANGNVYVGGQFTNSGNQAITNLAIWNGTSWAAVGGGVNNLVLGLAINGSDLYACGAFTQAGNVPANYIARWDGGNWNALGSGLSGFVNSIALFNNDVHVSGTFTTAGGVAATNFAIWTGASWSGAGAGLSGTGYKLLGTTSNLYAGGAFTTAGGVLVNGIASWDGTRWSAIGTAGRIAGLNAQSQALASDGTNLIAGGSFTFAGLTNAARIGRFDGTNWAPFGNGLAANVRAVAFVGTNLYAGGDFNSYKVAQWNGASWGSLTNFYATVVNALATNGNDLYIAGDFDFPAPDGRALNLARWDGTNIWRGLRFNSTTAYIFYVDNTGIVALAVDGPKVYVSGRCEISECDQFLTNCTNCVNVMYFDGTYTHGLGSGLNSNANAITVWGTNVYFAGPFTNAGGNTARGIARWNGSTWSEVGGGIVGNGIIRGVDRVRDESVRGRKFHQPGRRAGQSDRSLGWQRLGRAGQRQQRHRTRNHSGRPGPVSCRLIPHDRWKGSQFHRPLE
jgi:hypothetical protein